MALRSVFENGYRLCWLVFPIVCMLVSCSGNKTTTIDLMPAPAAYTDTGLSIDDRFLDKKVSETNLKPIFYATDRAPAASGTLDSRPYSSERGGCVRLGRASVIPASENLTWADAWKVSLLKSDVKSFPIKVNKVDEFGILAKSLSPFSKVSPDVRDSAPAAARRYAREINQHFAKTNSRDIHIYVHGYRNVFENPVLATAEFWHFNGLKDVFIAYSWPATPKLLAYISDSETTHVSARSFRTFLRFLAEETKVRRINIIGYSAGSRLVTRALADLALEERHRSPASSRQRLKLGTVSILAGDVDRGVLGSYLNDGILDILEHLVVYQSKADRALLIPRLLTGANRSGESMKEEDLTREVRDYLFHHPKLALVDVSAIDSARKGSGHSYLRGSPWVSSDLLLSLNHALGPKERGLVRSDQSPVWHFPPDYVTRLREILIKLDPTLAN